MSDGTGIRAAGPGDVEAMRAILAAHGEEAPPLPGHPDIVGPYLHHLVAHHRALVVDEGAGIVAFGAVLDTGRCRMLTDLFVTPSRLGQGLGRKLLAALFGDAPRRATFSSADPRALPSYVRAGMAPLWVNFYLQGDPSRLPEPPAGFVTRDATAAECAALERAWTGADRAVDHEYTASIPGADAFVIDDATGAAVAFGYARPKQVSEARDLDRTLVRPDVEPVGAFLAALARLRDHPLVETCVPGPNPLLPVLLEAGFRITDHDQYMASHPDIVDPVRLLPNPGLL